MPSCTASSSRPEHAAKGHRGDLRDIYAVSYVVLSLPPQPESFGGTVLEPLGEGRLVVAYAQWRGGDP
ncbi:MAG: hypothetical protein V2I24_07135 [Halieaceae bacterium]|jgi:hypothetical protein|nr:hypothetical protein [Halieaceae bacterium]